MMDTCIVTTVYGVRYLNWLGPFLESVRAIPNEPVVYVVRGTETNVESYLDAYPNVRWIEYEESVVGSERVVRVGRKIRGLRAALNIIRDGSRVVLSDVDTLWLMHPDKAWTENGGRIQFGYTVREGRWPINSGVIFGEVSKRFLWEIGNWETETERWMTTPEKIKQATDAAGHPDQMALKKIIAMMPETTGLIAKKLPASKWNRDECPNLGDVAGVACLHLKGCLPLLLKERAYGPPADEREQLHCEPVFEHWRRLATASNERRGL